jgi:hypothetical protein
MKLWRIAAGLVFMVAGNLAAWGQEATPATAANTPPATKAADTLTGMAGTGKITLKEGTDVSLKFAQDLSSKTAAEDDPVNLVLAEDLKVCDMVIAKAGAKAVGIITHAKKAGMMGKAGELNMRLQYLLVGDTRVKLRGTKGKEGQGKEGTAVALTVLFGPIGLIKQGKNVDIKEGTPLQAYTDESYELPADK